jgi:hypothetical protein
MPITQSRFISVLEQSARLEQTLDGLKTAVRETIEMERAGVTGEPAGPQLLAYLAALEITLLQWPKPDTSLITLENYHFGKFSRKNDYNRERMRRRTGASGEAVTAPQSLKLTPDELRERRGARTITPPAPSIAEKVKLTLVQQTVAQSDLDLLTPQELRGLGFDEDELKEMGLVAKPETESDPDT